MNVVNSKKFSTACFTSFCSWFSFAARNGSTLSVPGKSSRILLEDYALQLCFVCFYFYTIRSFLAFGDNGTIVIPTTTPQPTTVHFQRNGSIRRWPLRHETEFLCGVSIIRLSDRLLLSAATRHNLLVRVFVTVWWRKSA